jgi:hypothetical protein
VPMRFAAARLLYDLLTLEMVGSEMLPVAGGGSCCAGGREATDCGNL